MKINSNSDRYLAISSWEELHQMRWQVDMEIEELGHALTASAKESVKTGAKATTVTVATVLLTRAVKFYLHLRGNAKSKQPLESGEADVGEVEKSTPIGFVRTAGILMWIDTLVKLLIDAREFTMRSLQRERL